MLPRPPPGERAWIALVATSFGVVALMAWGVLHFWTMRTNHMIEAVDALSEKTRVLVLGTSHVDCAIDPRRVGIPMMNLSGIATNYVALEGVLAAHAPRLRALEALVIELDIFALRYDTVRLLEGDYRRLLDLRPRIAPMRVDAGLKYALWYSQLVHHSEILGPFFATPKLVPAAARERFALGLDRPIIEVFGHGRARIFPGYREFEREMPKERDGAVKLRVHRNETRAVPEEVLQANSDALVSMVADARRRGLHVALLRFPHDFGYWHDRPAEWNREISQNLERLDAEFGPGTIPFWDYERASGFDARDFYDGDHLNGRGARKFTALFDERLRSWLNGKRRDAAWRDASEREGAHARP